MGHRFFRIDRIDMSIDQVVVIAFTIVIFLALFVFSIDLLDPLITKLDFDEVCRIYVLLAESNNGLDNSMKEALRQDLEKMNFEDISVSCEGVGLLKRGDISALEVEASYKTSRFTSLFKRETQSIRFLFKQSFIARKIVM